MGQSKMKQQQQAQLDVEGMSAHPRKLNWTKVLFDYLICLDTEAFEKWDGDLTMPSQQILEKDIPRTRGEDPLMKKDSFREVLRRITTFYCKQNGVTYQQGLLEVVYPFALLRRKDFKTKKCYAYFNAFMRKCFPKVLVQRVVQGRKQLPHAILAITLTEILLRFHYPQISHILKQNELPMSLIATQQLLTIFAKNVDIKLVYEIYDYFISKNNANYIFYMEVALIGLQEQVLLQANALGTVHKEIQNIKKLSTLEDLSIWFRLSEKIAKGTPESFIHISNQFCFSNRNLLSAEDVDKMLKSQDIIAHKYLPIGYEEVMKNSALYVLVVLDDVGDVGELEIIRVSAKMGSLPTFSQDKIYVLAARQKKLEEDTAILMKIASDLPNYRFLMLREYLVDGKSKKCQIF